MNDSPLVSMWRQYLLEPNAGLHLADPAHPLKLFIGRTDAGSPRFVIRTNEKPAKPSLSTIVSVERFEDLPGKWNLSLTLQDRKFDEVFLRLVDDIHSRSAGSPNEKVALDRVNSVIDEWRRLLKPRTSGLLTLEELRGLVGELWLLLGPLSSSRSMEAAVEGWLGPMGLPQDFWFADSGFHEVKSIGPATVRIKISSEHQLDVGDLELLVLKVGNCDDQTVGAVHLPGLVARVQGALIDEAVSPDLLVDRIQRLGVNLAESFYQDTWFVVSAFTAYEVGPHFPAIRGSELNPGTCRVKYQIELADIEAFKTYTHEVV